MILRKKCPTCGAETLRDGTTEHTSRVGPRVFIATLPARVCDTCGESVISAEVLRGFERARAHALATEGASDGKALRHLRKAAKLTGVELARLLNVSAETVSRWEHGTQTPDRATVTLFDALALDALEGRTTTRERLDVVAAAAAYPVESEPVRVVLQVFPSAA